MVQRSHRPARGCAVGTEVVPARSPSLFGKVPVQSRCEDVDKGFHILLELNKLSGTFHRRPWVAESPEQNGVDAAKKSTNEKVTQCAMRDRLFLGRKRPGVVLSSSAVWHRCLPVMRARAAWRKDRIRSCGRGRRAPLPSVPRISLDHSRDDDQRTAEQNDADSDTARRSYRSPAQIELTTCARKGRPQIRKRERDPHHAQAGPPTAGGILLFRADSNPRPNLVTNSKSELVSGRSRATTRVYGHWPAVSASHPSSMRLSSDSLRRPTLTLKQEP